MEVKAKGGLGWLLHARTGHEWMLVLCFRVKKGTFEQKQLAADLNLTPIDDVEEIHYYSQSPRVKVRNLKTPWQEVSIKVWKKSDIETPAFRKFLQDAQAGYLAQATKEKANPQDLTPWKVLGTKWHLMKTGLPKKGAWDCATLTTLLPLAEKHFATAYADFSAKRKISWKSGDNKVLGELHTKRKVGVELVLFVPKDSVTVGAIAAFGTQLSVKPHRDELDAVTIRFTQPDQVTPEVMRWIAKI